MWDLASVATTSRGPSAPLRRQPRTPFSSPPQTRFFVFTLYIGYSTIVGGAIYSAREIVFAPPSFNGGSLPSLDLGLSSRPHMCYVSSAIFSPPNMGRNHLEKQREGEVSGAYAEWREERGADRDMRAICDLRSTDTSESEMNRARSCPKRRRRQRYGTRARMALARGITMERRDATRGESTKTVGKSLP